MKELERASSTSVVRKPQLMRGALESPNRAHSVPKFAKIPSYAFSASNGLEQMRGCRAQQPVGSVPAGGELATSACATPSLPVLEPPVAAELPELEETFAELQLEKTCAELEQMPSGALVASSALKEMRNCALILMRSGTEIANLTDIALVWTPTWKGSCQPLLAI